MEINLHGQRIVTTPVESIGTVLGACKNPVFNLLRIDHCFQDFLRRMNLTQ